MIDWHVSPLNNSNICQTDRIDNIVGAIERNRKAMCLAKMNEYMYWGGRKQGIAFFFLLLFCSQMKPEKPVYTVICILYYIMAHLLWQKHNERGLFWQKLHSCQ